MLALGAAAGLALTSSTRLIADFEQSMSTVRAVTGATEEQFAALTDRARELGATTRFTASQAAQGMIELARAGFSVDEVLGGVEGTLKLAQAGALDLGRAAEITASTLRGMQLSVDDTDRVVDVLAAAANSANTNVSQLGDALKFVTPIAAGLGVSLEETTGAIQALSDAGFRGEMAGTGLRKVMISLEKQSNQGIDILARYGLTLDDVSVSSNGLVPALEKLAAAGITTGEAMTLFGLRGGPAFEILRSSVPKVDAATRALEGAAGTADRIAEVMDDNLNGAILRTVSALQELVIALGDTGPTSALEDALAGLADLLRLAAENADIVAVAFVALSARALLPLAISTIPRMIGSIGAANVALVALSRNAGVATAASRVLAGSMALIGGPATIAITAAAAAFVVLGRDAERGREAIARVETAISGAQQALIETQKYDQTFRTLAETASSGIPIFDQVAQSIRNVARALDDTTVAGFINEAQGLFNAIEENRAALQALEADRDEFIRKQQRGLGLTDEQAQARFDETDSADALRRAEQAVAVLELRLQAVGKNVFGEIDVLEALRSGGLDELERTLKGRLEKINEDAGLNFGEAAAQSATTNVQEDEADRLQEILNLEFQLDLARAKGDEAEIARLEDKLDIIARTEDLVRSGLNLSDAEIKAREQVNQLREAENEQLARTLHLSEQVSSSGVGNGDPRSDKEKRFTRDPSEDAEYDFVRERVRSGVSDALLEVAQGGDWQSVLGQTFYDVISENMRDSFDEVLKYLGDALVDVFSGSNGGAIGDIFGGIGSFFAGNRASGGGVSAGRRYLIGERGPEMFIPSTDGHVVSNEDLRANGRTGAVTGGGGFVIRMGDTIVNGDPSARTLQMIQDNNRRQAEQLPALIDQRIMDSGDRGRYG